MLHVMPRPCRRTLIPARHRWQDRVAWLSGKRAPRLLPLVSLLLASLLPATSHRALAAPGRKSVRKPAPRTRHLARPPAATAAQHIASGDWIITATAERAVARNVRSGEKIHLYRKSSGCEYTAFSGRILSVVGTFVSYELSEGSYCGGAGTSYATTLTAVDLARGGSVLPLSQLVSVDVLRATLKSDAWLARQAAAGHPCKLHKLAGTSAFTFHHLDGRRVALRLQVPGDCEPNPGGATRLGFVVSPPSWLWPRLRVAARRKTLGLR